MTDMDKGKVFLGICIFAGLTVLGLMLPKAANEFRSFERVVSVKGLCEREVPADKVIWPLTFKVLGDELSSVNAEIEKNQKAIKSFLMAGGIEESEITISIPSISDKYASEYGSNDRYYRYVANNTVQVCSHSIDKVMKLMQDQMSLIRKGINLETGWDSEPSFYFEGLNEIKPEMIEEATRNAREVALKFAKDSESKLGKIRNASQGTFSIDDRDSNTPQIKRVRIVTYVDYYLKN